MSSVVTRISTVCCLIATLTRATTTVESTTHLSFTPPPTTDVFATISIRNSSAQTSTTNPPPTCTSECRYGPIQFLSSYWKQVVFPTTIGTAIVVIDPARNTTTTTTRYDTEVVVSGTTIPVSSLLANDSLSMIPRPTTTNTNYASLLGGLEQSSPVAYPTEFIQLASEIGWMGTIPYVSDGSTICSSYGGPITPDATVTGSPLPQQTPRPPPVGAVDPNDPFGSWYILAGYYDQIWLSSYNLSTYFPNDPFLTAIYDCSTVNDVAPATAVQTVSGLLLETSTSFVSAPSTISSASPASSASAASPSPTATALPDSAPPSSSDAAAPPDTSPVTLPPPRTTTRPTNTGSGPAVSDSESAPSQQSSVSQLQSEHSSENQPQSTPDTATPPSSSCGIACYITSALGGTGVASPTSQSAPQGTFVVGGQTLSSGSTVTVGGTTYSVPTSGTGIFVNGVSTQLPTVEVSAEQTPSVQTEYIFSGQTLVPGSTIIVGDTTYALPTSGSEIYVNGVSTGLSAVGTGAVITVGSAVLTPTVNSGAASPSSLGGDSEDPLASSATSPSSASDDSKPQSTGSSDSDPSSATTTSNTATLVGTNSATANWRYSGFALWGSLLILCLV